MGTYSRNRSLLQEGGCRRQKMWQGVLSAARVKHYSIGENRLLEMYVQCYVHRLGIAVELALREVKGAQMRPFSLDREVGDG